MLYSLTILHCAFGWAMAEPVWLLFLITWCPFVDIITLTVPPDAHFNNKFSVMLVAKIFEIQSIYKR